MDRPHEVHPSPQYGIPYDTLINAIRAQIAGDVESIYAKVTSISTSAERQNSLCRMAKEISARLVGLRRWLGIERRIISPCRSVSIGFNLVPVDRTSFDFPALTYFSERTTNAFPICRCSRSAIRCGPTCLFIARSTIPGCSRCGALREPC